MILFLRSVTFLFVFSAFFSIAQDRNKLSAHPEQGLYTLKSDPNSNTISYEIISMRDEYSKTFCNSNGLYTKQASDFAMHYRGKDGEWYTYDKALSLGDEGVYRINKTDVPVIYDSNNGLVTMGYNRNGSVIRFGEHTLYSISDSHGIVRDETALRDLSMFSFDSEENRITYDNYWNGINRRIRFDLFEIETDYVLDHKPANLTNDEYLHFTEVYQIPKGAKIIEGIGENGKFGFKGALTLQGSDGQDLILFNLPLCYDQTYLSDKYGESARPILGEYVYKIIGNELFLTTVVPASWILDEARVFPLVIDPTASSYQGGIYPFNRYYYGCSYTLGVNVPAGTITGWYAQWQVTATGGGWRSEGRSQIGYNAAYQAQFQGSGNYGGTYNVNTPTYTSNNGNWAGGNMTFWWRGYRTWGSACCCNTYYQRRNYLYVYVNYSAGTPNPSAANSSVNPVCNPGQSVTLTASNPVGTVYWYTGSCGGTFVGTGTSINVSPNSTTTYYCRNYSNGVFSTNCASTTVTVSGTPAAPTASNVSINCAQTAALSASGAGTLTWYSNSNATGQLGTGPNYTTSSINANTTFYVASNVSGCLSSLTPVTVTVNAASTPSASNVNVNCGQTATLTANANAPLYWFSNANGTGPLGSGNSYTTGAINSPTTVYVQAGSGACASQLVAVTASPNVAQPNVANTSINCGQTASVTATGANTYYWYSDAAGTNQVGSSATYTTPALTSNTTYYVGGASGAPQSATQVYAITSTGQLYNMGSSCGAGSYYSCGSGLRGINWTDNLPAGTQVTNVQIQLSMGVVCSNGSLPIFLNNNPGSPFSPNYHCNCNGSNNGIFTFNFPGNQYVVGGANQFRINAPSCTGLFNGNGALSGQFARITVTYQSAACVSPLVPVLITVNQAASPSAQNQTVSCMNTATFTANSNAPVTWFSNANGTGQVGSGANFTTPALSANTTYYMQAGSGGCASQLVPVTATVTAAQAPTANSISVQCQTSGTINASASSPVTWFSNANGTGSLGSGLSFNTPALTANTTYYIQAGTGACASQLVPVSVTVTQAQTPTANNVTVGCGSTATLSASASSPVVWYSNSNGTGQIGSGATYTTGQIYAPTTVYIQAGAGACASQLVPVTAAPNSQPPSAQNVNTNCGATATLTASGGSNYTWFTNANGTGQVGTGANYTTPALNATTTYYVASVTGGGVSNFSYTSATQSIYSNPGTVAFVVPSTPQANGNATLTVYVRGDINSSNEYVTVVSETGNLGNVWGGSQCGGFISATYTISQATLNSWVANGSINLTFNSTSSVNNICGFAAQVYFTISYQSGSPSCISATTPVVVSINPLASPVVSGNTSICAASNTQLTASGSAGSYNWYANSNGTGSLGSGVSYTTPNLNANTTYYVQAVNNGCTSNLIPVSVSVTALPAAPSANAASICVGQTATINASANANWYTVPSGGASIGQAQSYTTPSLNNTITYYMEGVNGPCVSATRTPVTVTVNPGPATNAGTSIVDASTCGKNTVNVGGNALSAGESGQWTVVSAVNNAGIPGVFSLGTSANDVFTGHYGATYVLQWEITNQSNGCVGTDTMVVTFNQPIDASIAGLIGTGDLMWCGLTGTDWSTSTNWYQKQAAGHYIRMSGAVQPTINNEVYTVNLNNGGICIGSNTIALSASSNAGEVYIGPGITWNLSNDTINIAENLINNGTIIASTGVVNFTGSNNSTISGSGNTQLFDMRVNKSAGATLTLQHPVLVTNTLTMNQGNVFTTSANLLTLGSSSAAPGSLSYNSGTIVGPFKRYFANSASAGTAGLFPVGTASYNRYADFSFGSGPGVDQYLTVEYITGAPLQGGVPLYNGLPLTASGSLIQNYSADGYWSVIPTNNNYAAPITSVNYGVTLFANNLTGMQSPQVCRIIKSAGSNTAAQHHVIWQACGTHTPINSSANPQAFLITSTATQGFSWFNIGTPNSQALPVELLSFNGDCNDGQVNLSWQTATEHNSDYFEVEKSRDGMNWQVLTTVNAAGNSTQLLNYQTVDAHAMEGNNYYRLTQVDIDGTTKTYDVINVSCSGSGKGYFSAYPNPSTGSFQVILNDKNLVGTGVLNVKDTKGAAILNRMIEVKPGINMFSVTDLNLAPGVYYIQIVNGERATEVLKEVIR